MGEMNVYLYVPNIKTPTRQIHANTYSQVTRRFQTTKDSIPTACITNNWKARYKDTKHAMGRQGTSGISGNRKDAYGLTIAPRKRLGSISPIPFSRMHSVGIGGQGFRDIGGSRSCPDAGTRQMPTLASGMLPVAIVGLVRGRHCWHRRTGIPELLTNRGTGTWSVTRRIVGDRVTGLAMV